MWADSAWFVLLRLYLVCYLVLIVTCAVTPVDHLSSPIPPEYVNAIVSDTDPILALYPLAAVSCIAVLKGRIYGSLLEYDRALADPGHYGCKS